jgi:hypothetical protein
MTGHRHDHRYPGHHCCAYRCPTCGPDADAWALGELVMATVVAGAALLAWMVRHPRLGAAGLLTAVAAALLWGWW